MFGFSARFRNATRLISAFALARTSRRTQVSEGATRHSRPPLNSSFPLIQSTSNSTTKNALPLLSRTPTSSVLLKAAWRALASAVARRSPQSEVREECAHCLTIFLSSRDLSPVFSHLLLSLKSIPCVPLTMKWCRHRQPRPTFSPLYSDSSRKRRRPNHHHPSPLISLPALSQQPTYTLLSFLSIKTMSESQQKMKVGILGATGSFLCVSLSF